MEELEKDIGRDMTPKLIKELGMRYPTEKSSRKYRYGLYECQYCNKEFEAITSSIKSGTKSCGCQHYKPREKSIKHNLSNHKYYNTWKHMVGRCTNPNNKDYKHYGGRGITVCDEWLDVVNFIHWAEKTYPNIEGLSLDRIENDKGYSPENCRWADRTTQNTNQRMKSNNTSGYVGVGLDKRYSVWMSYLFLDKKRHNIGYFKTIEEAVLARDNYIIENKLPHKLSTDYKREES